MPDLLNRRKLLQTSALAGVGFWVSGLPAADISRSSADKLRIAAVGVGGRGAHNLRHMSGEQVVALVDINELYLDRAAKLHPKAKRYTDFRRLFDRAGDFDAVVVSTTE